MVMAASSAARMGQNRSTAVMQRRVEAPGALDDYPTPPWATRALIEALQGLGCDLSGTVREPAANRGHMVRPLVEAFGLVEASDVFDYGAGFAVADYLFGPPPPWVDWTITNPPFRLAERFIFRARSTSTQGVAMLVRTSFLEGAGRWRALFDHSPPTDVLQFCERVVMKRGRLDGKGSSATSYCWLVWRAGVVAPPVLRWIAPCRKRLERAGDYPAGAAGVATVGGLI